MGTAPDGTVIRIPDRPVSPGQAKPFANYSFASPGYFFCAGHGIIAWKEFKETDNATSMPVTIINHTMAKKLWPHEDAIGKQVGVANVKFPVRVIVGIIADIKHGSLREDVAPEMYVPYTQNEIKVWPSMQAMQFAARTKSDPAAVTGSIRSAVHAVDRDLPVAKIVAADRFGG